jgi:hypothetical protein
MFIIDFSEYFTSFHLFNFSENNKIINSKDEKEFRTIQANSNKRRYTHLIDISTIIELALFTPGREDEIDHFPLGIFSDMDHFFEFEDN